jgi:hypothetical protein
MTQGINIILKVAGAEIRYGKYVEDLSFDDMVRVHITSYLEKNRVKELTSTQEFDYLAHRSDVYEDS